MSRPTLKQSSGKKNVCMPFEKKKSGMEFLKSATDRSDGVQTTRVMLLFFFFFKGEKIWHVYHYPEVTGSI